VMSFDVTGLAVGTQLLTIKVFVAEGTYAANPGGPVLWDVTLFDKARNIIDMYPDFSARRWQETFGTRPTPLGFSSSAPATEAKVEVTLVIFDDFRFLPHVACLRMPENFNHTSITRNNLSIPELELRPLDWPWVSGIYQSVNDTLCVLTNLSNISAGYVYSFQVHVLNPTEEQWPEKNLWTLELCNYDCTVDTSNATGCDINGSNATDGNACNMTGSENRSSSTIAPSSNAVVQCNGSNHTLPDGTICLSDGTRRLIASNLSNVSNAINAGNVSNTSASNASASDASGGFMPFPSGVGFDATAPGTAVAAALGNTGDPSASEPATTTSGDNGSASVTVIPDLKVTFPLVGYFVGEEHPDFVREDESAALSPRRPQPLVVAAVVVAAAVAALDAAT